MKNKIDRETGMTAGEREFIDRFVADYCRPHRDVMAERLAAFVARRQMEFVAAAPADVAMAAGVRTSTSQAPSAPDEEVRFAFASDGPDDVEDSWRAEVRIPPGAGPETMLAVTVRGFRNVSASGVFSISGCALPIVDGAAEIPFGLFLAGIQNTDVSLKRPGGKQVAGRLLFF